MSWVSVSKSTALSSIYTHESPCHVSQNRMVAPRTLPLPLQHHSRRQSWHQSGVSSISLLQPEQVLIWWKCIWLQVQKFFHNLFLLSGRNHEEQILFFISLWYHLEHAWSCRSISKLQWTSLFGLGTTSQTSFFMIDWYSSIIASFHSFLFVASS